MASRVGSASARRGRTTCSVRPQSRLHRAMCSKSDQCTTWKLEIEPSTEQGTGGKDQRIPILVPVNNLRQMLDQRFTLVCHNLMPLRSSFERSADIQYGGLH